MALWFVVSFHLIYFDCNSLSFYWTKVQFCLHDDPKTIIESHNTHAVKKIWNFSHFLNSLLLNKSWIWVFWIWFLIIPCWSLKISIFKCDIRYYWSILWVDKLDKFFRLVSSFKGFFNDLINYPVVIISSLIDHV